MIFLDFFSATVLVIVVIFIAGVWWSTTDW